MELRERPCSALAGDTEGGESVNELRVGSSQNSGGTEELNHLSFGGFAAPSAEDGSGAGSGTRDGGSLDDDGALDDWITQIDEGGFGAEPMAGFDDQSEQEPSDGEFPAFGVTAIKGDLDGKGGEEDVGKQDGAPDRGPERMADPQGQGPLHLRILREPVAIEHRQEHQSEHPIKIRRVMQHLLQRQTAAGFFAQTSGLTVSCPDRNNVHKKMQPQRDRRHDRPSLGLK